MVCGDVLTRFAAASHVVVSLLGSATAVIALPEFAFLLEQEAVAGSVPVPSSGASSGALDRSTRLCRYLQFPALWVQLIQIARARGAESALKQALAAVGQVPKALFEGVSDHKTLLKQGNTAAAVARCCDLWDFEAARQIVLNDRRCGPVLVYLRR